MPNPITAILGGVGSTLSSAASDVFNSSMLAIWDFATTLLTGAFGLIARLAQPSVDPSSGVLKGILPTILWCGGLTLFVLVLVQIARSVMSGGRGFATLFVGLGQYLVVTAGGWGFLAVLVRTADGLASGILSAGLSVDGWRGINGQNSTWLNSAHAVGGVGVGLTALFLVIPAAIGLLIEAVVRYAAIVVLAATIPILAAGLVNESTTQWFWTGMRWMLALLLLTPATALVLVIGLRGAASAAGADGASAPGVAQSTVQLVVGGVIMLIALLCPVALFKLLAFLDPNTGAGMQMRSYFAGSGSSPMSGLSSPDGDDGEGDTERRFGAAASGAVGDMTLGKGQSLAASSSSTAGSMLDSVGAGHAGTNPPPARGNRGGGSGRAGGPNQAEPDVLDPIVPTPGSPSPNPGTDLSPVGGSTAGGAAADGALTEGAAAAVVAL